MTGIATKSSEKTWGVIEGDQPEQDGSNQVQWQVTQHCERPELPSRAKAALFNLPRWFYPEACTNIWAKTRWNSPNEERATIHINVPIPLFGKRQRPGCWFLLILDICKCYSQLHKWHTIHHLNWWPSWAPYPICSYHISCSALLFQPRMGSA